MGKLIRDELKDTYGILALQEEILGIMVYVDSFCKEQGIDYCLMAGSALGAFRHHGFIPWDDDIDIYMFSSDYQKFKKAFEEKGDKEKYYIQEYGKTFYNNLEMITMAKIKLNGSWIEEEAYTGWNIHKGIFVDIFIIHNLPDNKIRSFSQYLWSEAVVLKGLSIRGYKGKNVIEKVLLSVIRAIPTNWLLNHGLFNAYKYDREKTSRLMGFFDTRSYSRAVFSYDCIYPTNLCRFEKVDLRIPANIDEYLTTQFGKDYMTPTPVEKRIINKHAKSWFLDKDITYDYSDEKKLI